MSFTDRLESSSYKAMAGTEEGKQRPMISDIVNKSEIMHIGRTCQSFKLLHFYSFIAISTIFAIGVTCSILSFLIGTVIQIKEIFIPDGLSILLQIISILFHFMSVLIFTYMQVWQLKARLWQHRSTAFRFALIEKELKNVLDGNFTSIIRYREVPKDSGVGFDIEVDIDWFRNATFDLIIQSPLIKGFAWKAFIKQYPDRVEEVEFANPTSAARKQILDLLANDTDEYWIRDNVDFVINLQPVSPSISHQSSLRERLLSASGGRNPDRVPVDSALYRRLRNFLI